MKCYVRLNNTWRSNIKATLICFVPRLSILEHKPLAGSDLTITSTVDGLVILETFSKGTPYQLPLHLIEIVESWYEDDVIDEGY